MTEGAVFPLLGAAFVILIVLPCCALLAKGTLALLERDALGGPLHGLTLRYVLLTGSSILPSAWFLSAALHQVETGQSVLACLFDHDTAALCFEPAYFALTLVLVLLTSSYRVLRGAGALAISRGRRAEALAARIERLLATRPELGALADACVVTDEPGFALATHGLWRPRVFVGLTFAEQLSNDMLAAALGHELEHVNSRDPLRYLVLQLALAMNPFGRALLEPHVARWRAAREAHCDREAVIRGAAPLPLADAIVRAARPEARDAVALGARDTAVLEFRISLLLAFAERPPARCCHHGPSAFPLAFALLAFTLLLPHRAGTGALDALHTGAEQALTYFTGSEP